MVLLTLIAAGIAAQAPAAEPRTVVTIPPPAASTVPGPTGTPSAKATKLIELLGAEATLDSVIQTLVPLVGIQATTAIEANPETRSYATALFGKLPGGRARFAQLMSEEMRREMRKTYPEIKAKLASLYDSAFTPEELDELIRFYGSGVGAKFIRSEARFEAELEAVGRAAGERAGRAAAPAAMLRAAKEAGIDVQDKRS